MEISRPIFRVVGNWLFSSVASVRLLLIKFHVYKVLKWSEWSHTVVRVIWGQFFTYNFSSKIWKQFFFYFLKPILSPPYLGPYMCSRFHAKFHDSRTNNKKRPPPFNLTQKHTVKKTFSQQNSKLKIFLLSKTNFVSPLSWSIYI